MPRVLASLVAFCLSLGLAGSAGAGVATVTVPIGVVFTETPVTLIVPFTYTGKTAATLTAIKTSCDCLQAAPLTATAVAPGETLSLVFTYRGAKPGKVAVTVLMLGAGPDEVLATANVVGFVADPCWIVSPAELLTPTEKPPVLWIDTRSAERYAQAHIPRSLSLPLFALKTRTDLRTQPIILVDEGFSSEVLLDEAIKLRTRGFTQVRVLSGGLGAWMRQGGPVEGLLANAVSYAVSISPAEFTRAQVVTAWDRLEISQAGEVAPALAEGAGAGPLLVMAVSADESVYAQVEARWGTKARRPVYYLSGGKPAWDVFEVSQTELAAHTGQVFQSKPSSAFSSGFTSGCGSCGSK